VRGVMTNNAQNIVSNIEKDLSFREHLDLQEWNLRRNLATTIMNTFLTINGTVLALVIIMYISDTVFLAKGIIQSSDRIIETKVIISIIGATTIQLGAIALALSQWLFPKNEASRQMV
jgi:spore maturation protein SpmA